MSRDWDSQQATMTNGKTGHSQAYGDEKYWDSRYSNDAGSFDWYQRYTGLSPLVNKYVPKTDRVLMVGCGNAVISEDMVNDGYQDIVNVDISSVVIDAMQKKYEDVPQLSYIRLDVRDMTIFKDSMFDAVIDKDNLRRSSSSDEPSQASEVELVYRCTHYTYCSTLISTTEVLAVKMLHDARPGSKRAGSSSKVANDPLLFNNAYGLDVEFSLDDPDLHYVYVCEKDGIVCRMG